MSKHTPGPWYIAALKGKYYYTRVMIGDDQVIEVNTSDGSDFEPSERELANGFDPKECDGYSHVEDARTLADARLIAAAPDMYEALKGAFKLCSDPSSPEGRQTILETIRKMVDALDKAEGRA